MPYFNSNIIKIVVASDISLLFSFSLLLVHQPLSLFPDLFPPCRFPQYLHHQIFLTAVRHRDYQFLVVQLRAAIVCGRQVNDLTADMFFIGFLVDLNPFLILLPLPLFSFVFVLNLIFDPVLQGFLEFELFVLLLLFVLAAPRRLQILVIFPHHL